MDLEVGGNVMVWKAAEAMRSALDAVIAERQRQDAKWGEQNHPMVPETHDHHAGWQYLAAEFLEIPTADRARDACDRAHRRGEGTYTHILVEEVAEFVEACVLHGDASDEARAEMVQVAAVALAMLECIDRKRAKVTP